MRTQPPAIRQGLPRYLGGEPWPPAPDGAALATATPKAAPVAAEPIPAQVAQDATASPAASPAPATHTVAVRQGMPRSPGGAPWPPESTSAVAASVASAPRADSAALPTREAQKPAVRELAAGKASQHIVMPAAEVKAGVARGDVRQGLPRTIGGPAWPPLDAFPEQPVSETAAPAPAPEQPRVISQAAAVPAKPAALGQKADAAPSTSAEATAGSPAPAVEMKAAPQAASAQAGTAPAASKPANPMVDKVPEARKYGPLTLKQVGLAGVIGAFCALGMATAVVLLARWVAGFEAVEGFLDRYPGEYHLPDYAPVGVPVWLGWQHFFNFFLMVLIIRSGMLVRHQQKPPAYWSSKRSPKVSINLWLHQSLDVLWLLNGVVFLVLLFATGHWMRIVPTSWEVFPNAISAGIQYLTLDWPTENGWVNYNSLQQLAYFTTVFIAAPVAAITGYRMSAFWPKNAKGLNKAYPLELARKLHFPTMLYFLVFILIHVALVLSTGALRNLNHMYAAQGSVDPAEYAGNWLGLIMFGVSLLAIAGAWIACRPMLLTPVAQLFGKVTSR